jgi:cysteine desulfurase
MRGLSLVKSMTGRPIYLDYHATTPVDPRVAAIVSRYMMDDFGNAGSVDHSYGDLAAEAVETARLAVAELVGTRCANVVFTSGATEAANLALWGLAGLVWERGHGRPLRIGLMTVEHLAVLRTAQALAQHGLAELTYFSVDGQGQIILEEVEQICSGGLDLVCAMAANNEVGTVYPTPEISAFAHRCGALLFIDASQAAGRIDLKFDEWSVDLLAVSAHKMYGPKGAGALVVRPGIRLEPIAYGGGQEHGLRSGTLNVPAIAGFGEACKWRMEERLADERRIAALRDTLQDALLEALPGSCVNGAVQRRLAGNLNISFRVPAQAVIARVRHALAVSTGSACSSGIEQPSHVLRAMHLDDWRLAGAIRFGIGKFTTRDDILRAAGLVIEAVQATEKVLNHRIGNGAAMG